MTTELEHLNDCFLHDKDRLAHKDAIALLQQRLTCMVEKETVSLNSALGRVLAETVTAPHNVPLHTNSAVDGYAFRHADLDRGALPVSTRIAAGDLDPAPLKEGGVARIFTGAPMPAGADTVAMQEDCDADNNVASLPKGLKPGANCRHAGEDLIEGAIVVDGGQRLRPSDLAALASIGEHRVQVSKKLRVTLLSSGDELRRVGETEKNLAKGEVWDTNSVMLEALLSPLPVEHSVGPVIADSAKAVKSALARAAENSDVIITTGGASRGDEDHMLNCLAELGKRHLWQLAVKPGRPMLMGQIDRSAGTSPCLYFGLPGNPVAAMVCFLLYVRPSLLTLCGAKWQEPARFPLPADFEIQNKKPDRREFLRGKLHVSSDGQTIVRKFPRDGSGLISSLRESDGLIEIPEPTTSIEKGCHVNFIPFSSFD